MEPIVLLHGALGAREQLLPLSSSLEADFDVSIVEFSGHGATQGDASAYRMPRLADDIRRSLDARGTARAHLFARGFRAPRHAW